MRLKPLSSRGEVFKLPSGEVVLLPFEVLPWRSNPGGVVIRLGDSTYWFLADGKYDGPELHFSRHPNEHEEGRLQRLLDLGRDNIGKAPEKLYFSNAQEGDLKMEVYDGEGIPHEALSEKSKATTYIAETPDEGGAEGLRGKQLGIGVPEGMECLDDATGGFENADGLGAFLYNVFNELKVSDVVVVGIDKKKGEVKAFGLRKGSAQAWQLSSVIVAATKMDGVMSFAQLGRPPLKVYDCCASTSHDKWNHPRNAGEGK